MSKSTSIHSSQIIRSIHSVCMCAPYRVVVNRRDDIWPGVPGSASVCHKLIASEAEHWQLFIRNSARTSWLLYYGYLNSYDMVLNI